MMTTAKKKVISSEMEEGRKRREWDQMVVKNCLIKAGVKKDKIDTDNWELSDQQLEQGWGCMGFGYSGFGEMKIFTTPEAVSVHNTLPNGSSETFEKLCIQLLKSFGESRKVTASWSDMFGADHYDMEKIKEWANK